MILKLLARSGTFAYQLLKSAAGKFRLRSNSHESPLSRRYTFAVQLFSSSSNGRPHRSNLTSISSLPSQCNGQRPPVDDEEHRALPAAGFGFARRTARHRIEWTASNESRRIHRMKAVAFHHALYRQCRIRTVPVALYCPWHIARKFPPNPVRPAMFET